MQSEFLQLAVVAGVFLAVAVAWLFIIYIPGRTMENWNGGTQEPPVESDSKLR